ncbi:MAG: hypothetical protein ACKO26_18595, partial [Planctomycetota bacterium]
DAVSAELARGLERFDIIVDAANGKAMAYAEAHAEISSKELVGVTMRLKGLASSEDVAKLRRLGARPADQVEPGALGDF